ncbi:hypothetical protein FVEG_06143 [Fusarium verticillioides 7600]|uniref:Uncharacterized protein n=1 Tax=Gibberella moniliformis (strain M3125 / FGSC 7600) TaxID=334819 RepID=W7MCM0_GIBM7|nr:hypothetical protein FVEG_06143 [Fusarium verticillioides 7600]EWG45314.1 hypothetical protein FVEG_06143 [Fusarium verticillioides 7600]
MAQEIAVQGPLASMNELAGLAEKERHQIEQYEKIVRFSTTVLSGKHPTIKVPSNFIPSTQTSIHPIDTSTQDGTPNVSATDNSKPYGSGSTEINPIFLEKSEDLVKAELKLQRQRLERALRDEVDQRRVTAKTVAQGEPVVEFDLNEVLTKALTLVESNAGPETTTAAAAADATNIDNASDSFDDNTFYSSQHNTPSSVLTSRVRNESEEAQVPVAESQPKINRQNAPIPQQPSSRFEQVPPGPYAPSHTRPQEAYANPDPFVGSVSVNSTSRPVQVPGLATYNADKTAPRQDRSARQSPSNGESDRRRADYGSASRQPPREHYIDSRPPSPLIRAHERPHQNAQTSPLMNNRPRPRAAEATSTSSTGTPAQVAALRNEPVAVTSPESSPQGGASDRRKPKKKKRKADRQAPETEPTPYIKAEPRSPSPMNAPSYIRPNKRQRYAQQQPDEPVYEEVGYEPRPALYPPEPVPVHNRQERDDRVPIGYDTVGFSSQRAASTTVPGTAVYRREYADDRHVSGGPYPIEQSPHGPPPHQSLSMGTAGSQVRPNDGYPRPSWPYAEVHEASPTGLRPEGDVFMAPHRPPPTRIIVDAYGREYIEPPRSTNIRHSAAPPARSGEPEIFYERTPVRRPQAMEAYEEGGAVYRIRSPSYMPRRVVTQPEYVSQDYRDHRPREYSTRPIGPSGEFVEVMAPPERRRMEDGTRDYITRPTSVRPAEPVRYEVARDYGRVQSVRPEPPVRQYATSVHPEGRREAVQPYAREYGAIAAEPGVVRQEYSTRPVERYYNQPMRGGEEIAFIERPRGATQEIVYADDARREVYR